MTMQLGTGSLGIWAWLFLVAILIATNTTASQPSLAAAAPRIAGSRAPHLTLFFLSQCQCSAGGKRGCCFAGTAMSLFLPRSRAFMRGDGNCGLSVVRTTPVVKNVSGTARCSSIKCETILTLGVDHLLSIMTYNTIISR